MITKVQKEMEAARTKYGAFHSSHEVYGVLKEEVDEFWELVKDKDKLLSNTKRSRMITELTQIASVAIRAAKELENGEIKFL